MATATIRTPPTAVAPVASRPLEATRPRPWLRLVAFAALVTFCSSQWARQVDPTPGGAAVSWSLAAVVLGAALLLADGRRRAPAVAIAAVATVATLAWALLACGVPLVLLRPDRWGDLASGLGDGLSALPDLRVPYRGFDEWTRTVVLGGGALLALAGAALACAPVRRGRGVPGGAVLAVGVLYATGVIEKGPHAPFASGALFCVLLAALLSADRLGPEHLPGALGIGVAALAAALLLAPRLDGRSSWIDYRHLSELHARRASTQFNWDQTYGPLRWPRQPEETLRVRATEGGYWKGATLSAFDGVRWTQAPIFGGDGAQGPDTEIDRAHPEWQRTVTVDVRKMTSTQLYAPGEVLGVTGLGRPIVRGNGGTADTAPEVRPLGPGDSYRAKVYAPDPTGAQMRSAGAAYPAFLADALSLRLPPSFGAGRPGAPPPPSGSVAQNTLVTFGAYGTSTAGRPSARTELGDDGSAIVGQSGYARDYALAQKLRRASSTPYDLVRRVQARVRRGAVYDETPPHSALPLDTFLFERRAGYCQQFSGAMALLLRMAGVPARVASGFAPGDYDAARRQYVTTDLDAHAWVEVYFPRIGWVPFDPTPAGSTLATHAGPDAVSAADGGAVDGASDKPVARQLQPAGGNADVGGPDPDARRGGGGSPWPLVVGVLVVVALGASLPGTLRRRRERRAEDDPALGDLRRAFVASGRPVGAGATLASLAAHVHGDAAAYVHALQTTRYAPSEPAAQTRHGRAALRRELARGRPPLARVRTWLALAPWLR